MADKSQERHDKWLLRVHNLHNVRTTPEQRAALHNNVEESRSAEVNMRRCNAIRGHMARSHDLLGMALGQMACASAPGNLAAVQQRWQSEQNASADRQHAELSGLGTADASVQVLPDMRDATTSSPAAAIYLPGPLFPGTWGPAMPPVVPNPLLPGPLMPNPLLPGPLIPYPLLPGPVLPPLGRWWDRLTRRRTPSEEPVPKRVRSESFEKRLEQFRIEPQDEDERQAKFGIYEAYMPEVEKMRQSCEELAPMLPADLSEAMEKQLNELDKREAMGVRDSRHEWIVYRMMDRAEENNHLMEELLAGFQAKFDKLSKINQPDCPVCLEPFTENGPQTAVTLSCCHKVCQECWEHWTSMRGSTACCPLCRHSEFRDAVSDHVARRPGLLGPPGFEIPITQLPIILL